MFSSRVSANRSTSLEYYLTLPLFELLLNESQLSFRFRPGLPAWFLLYISLELAVPCRKPKLASVAIDFARYFSSSFILKGANGEELGHYNSNKMLS